MNSHNILVVDDDLAILKFLRANLEARRYRVSTARDGEEALHAMEKDLPDLVILDVIMPKLDGFEVCCRIREWSQVPVIMLSARRAEEDKVKCLELGGDDYVTKPFGVEELVARVEAVFRRSQLPEPVPTKPVFESGQIDINFAQRRVTIGSQEVKLTPTEYRLLQELALNAGKVLTHRMLLNRVWGSEYGNEREYVRVFINRLRNKIEPNPANPRYILTEYG
ncbi:MAG: response regulator transcription factor, partial [Dehalococcoidia bacterium]